MITSEQIRAARALLRWEQRDLADASKVSLPSIKRLEMIPGPLVAMPRTIEALRAALEAAGIEFTNGGRLGVKVKPLERGDKVRLRRASERHAITFGIGAKEIATIEEWEVLPTDPPWGRFRLRLSSGAATDWLEPSNFKRASGGDPRGPAGHRFHRRRRDRRGPLHEKLPGA